MKTFNLKNLLFVAMAIATTLLLSCDNDPTEVSNGNGNNPPIYQHSVTFEIANVAELQAQMEEITIAANLPTRKVNVNITGNMVINADDMQLLTNFGTQSARPNVYTEWSNRFVCPQTWGVLLEYSVWVQWGRMPIGINPANNTRFIVRQQDLARFEAAGVGNVVRVENTNTNPSRVNYSDWNPLATQQPDTIDISGSIDATAFSVFASYSATSGKKFIVIQEPGTTWSNLTNETTWRLQTRATAAGERHTNRQASDIMFKVMDRNGNLVDIDINSAQFKDIVSGIDKELIESSNGANNFTGLRPNNSARLRPSQDDIHIDHLGRTFIRIASISEYARLSSLLGDVVLVIHGSDMVAILSDVQNSFLAREYGLRPGPGPNDSFITWMRNLMDVKLDTTDRRYINFFSHRMVPYVGIPR